MLVRILQLAVILFALNVSLTGQDHGNHDGHDHSGHDHAGHSHASGAKAVESHDEHDAHGEHQTYDPAGTAVHHISDANVLTILDAITIPLPCMLYSEADGWKFMMSNSFGVGHHENGHKAIDRYVLMHGSVFRVNDPSFPLGEQEVGDFVHHDIQVEVGGKTKTKSQAYVKFHGKEYAIDRRSTWDGGFLGGGVTSFYDLSITKNVLALFIVSFLLFFAFRKGFKFYKNDSLTRAPKGITAMLETMFIYIRDEAAVPFIGKEKATKYLPILMSVFFFIVGLNLFGQVPFFGGINVTGNLTVTMVLALVVFVVVNLNGKKDYWQHIFWMPGVPTFVKFILTPVEIMSLFIKPLTLMLRLAGNISAGHIAILSFIGLIFIFGDSGQSLGGSFIGTAMSVPLTLFMMSIELIVAFVQAFVFTILTASYIGAAIEEHH